MIPLFDNVGGRLAVTYNGLTLNDPADAPTDTYELNTVAGRTAMDYISETNQQRDGLEIYPFRKVSRIVTVKGTLRAASWAKYFDRIKALAASHDPAKITHENGQDSMFLPLDFSVPTTDTATYPTGLVASRYYALPLLTPEPVIDYDTGFAGFFDIVYLLRDPRRYLQAEVTQSGNGTIANSKADYRSWPVLTITMSGAGSATFKVKNTHAYGAPELTLDLSGLSSGNVVVVNMERRKITVGGVDAPQRYVTGDYFEIEPGNNVIAYTNTTSTSSRVLAFRPAFCI